MANVYAMTEEAYRELSTGDGGICLGCGEHQYGDVEPDAEGYLCEACGSRAVMGVELALVRGRVEIVEVAS